MVTGNGIRWRLQASSSFKNAVYYIAFYATKAVCSSMSGVCDHTFHKWISLFIRLVANFELVVFLVSFESINGEISQLNDV